MFCRLRSHDFSEQTNVGSESIETEFDRILTHPCLNLSTATWHFLIFVWSKCFWSVTVLALGWCNGEEFCETDLGGLESTSSTSAELVSFATFSVFFLWSSSVVKELGGVVSSRLAGVWRDVEVVVENVVEVSEDREVSGTEWEILARCIGTTWLEVELWLASDEGGFRLKGATMAWGTFLIRHSWFPKKPGLVQKLPRGPRSTLRMGSVGRGLDGMEWWWDSEDEPQNEEIFWSWSFSPGWHPWLGSVLDKEDDFSCLHKCECKSCLEDLFPLLPLFSTWKIFLLLNTFFKMKLLN